MPASEEDGDGGTGAVDAPRRCTTCGTQMGRDAMRCPGCGKVFGEINRCHSCNAVAAVTPSGAGYACLACGAPRKLLPGMTVIANGPVGMPKAERPSVAPLAQGFASVASETPPVRSVGTGIARPSRLRALSLRAMGVILLAAGVGGAALSVALSGGATGLLLAVAVGGAGAGLGGLLLRAGGRASAHADRGHSLAMEQAILDLATQRAGVLRVTDVARGLGVTVAEADEALSALADGSRVTAEITPEGLLVYHFREIEAPARMRVDMDELSAEDDEKSDRLDDRLDDRDDLDLAAHDLAAHDRDDLDLAAHDRDDLDRDDLDLAAHDRDDLDRDDLDLAAHDRDDLDRDDLDHAESARRREPRG